MVVSYPPAKRAEGLGSEEKSMAVIRGFELKTLEARRRSPNDRRLRVGGFRAQREAPSPARYIRVDDRKDKGTVSCVRREEERLAGLVALLASEVTSIARPGFSQRSTEIARFH